MNAEELNDKEDVEGEVFTDAEIDAITAEAEREADAEISAELAKTSIDPSEMTDDEFDTFLKTVDAEMNVKRDEFEKYKRGKGDIIDTPEDYTPDEVIKEIEKEEQGEAT